MLIQFYLCKLKKKTAGIDLFRIGRRRVTQRDARGVQATLRRRSVHPQFRCRTSSTGVDAERLQRRQSRTGVTQLCWKHFRPAVWREQRRRRCRNDYVGTLRRPHVRKRPETLPQRRQTLPERQVQGHERERRRGHTSARCPPQYIRKPTALLAPQFMEFFR